MKQRFYLLATIMAFILLFMAGCGSDGETATPIIETPVPTATDLPTPSESVQGEAVVDSIQILILESFPVQVNVFARGNLPDGCTRIDRINKERSGDLFQVTISTLRPGGAVCSEALVPFEETIGLDVLGLDAGRYSVDVNGMVGSFTLDIDNRVPTDETPEPTATPEAEETTEVLASIGGRVWHDLCAISGGEGGEPAVPSEGCIAGADGASFQANGLMEPAEPGLGSIVVNLGEGACPAVGLDSAITDENGNFSFASLAAGNYCVSVDALDEQNSAILIPGGWTFPDIDVDFVTLSVADGEAITGVNFGWDYQFLPLPEVDLATCVNSIQFIEDLTIPDNTVLAPGETFEKRWRLRNSGTCPWTTEYSLVKVSGDGIGGPDSVLLSRPAAPGQTIDVSVSLTAPDEIGTYRDNWQLSNASGDPFGVGGSQEEAFWLQIVVAEPVATPVPGSASIGGVIWADFCQIRADGSPSAGCVETEEGSGFYRGDGTLSSGESRIPDLLVTLSDVACPESGAIPATDIIATTLTDAGGLYRFPGLDEGTYCVSIDAFSTENVDILIPGDWTWPAPGVGRITVILEAGESLLEIDFGWDDL